jgi:hypothetical protein
MLNNLALYPLDIDVTAMWKEDSPKEIFIFFILVIVIIVVIKLINSPKNRVAIATGSGSAGLPIAGIFSNMAMHRVAREIGLDHDQIKMLDFVFKTDQVVDPEKSISTPSLLDRHFRRAYRVIEQSTDSDAESQERLTVLFSTRNVLENSVSGGLSSTRHLKDDTTVIIGNGNDKYETSVLDASGENLAVECPKNALGSLLKLPRGTKLAALIFTKNNKGFSFETRVVGYTTLHGHSALLLSHSNQIKFLSQRRYRRRQCNIAANLYLVYVEGSGKKQRLVVDKRRLTGDIADISVGGCSIKTKAPIQVGSKLKIEFTQGTKTVAALGQVLRTNRAGVVTIIHLKFQRVTKKSMNIINAFVYEYAHE